MNARNFLIAFLALLLIIPTAGFMSAQQGDTPTDTPPSPQPFLGVQYQADDAGAVISFVFADSPAAEAGLQVGDVITAVNDEAVEGDNLASLVQAYAPGDEVTLAVTRGEESLTLEVTLGEYTGQFTPRVQIFESRPYLGVRLEDNEEGVTIVEVVEDSPAESIGLQVGDIIQMVNGQEVSTVEDVSATILTQKPSAQIMLTVLRGDETIEFDVILRALLPQVRHNVIPRDTFSTEMIRPYLGVQLDDTDAGVEIVSVESGSPAEEAGLQAGDVITDINDESMTALTDVVSTVQAMNVGDEVTLTILREEETVEISAVLGQSIIESLFREGRGNNMRDMPGRGGRSIIITPGDFAYDAEESVWIVGALAEDNIFYEAGLREGDRITQINGETYATDELDGFNFLFGMEETVILTVERDGEALELEVDGMILPSLFLGANLRGMHNRNGQRFDFMPEIIPARPAGARLGVTFIMLDEQTAAEYEVEQTEGALITDLLPRSPANNAGLEVNDIILAVDDQVLSTSLTLSDVISARQAGDVVMLDVLRNGESLQIEVTLGQPEQFGFYIPNLDHFPHLRNLRRMFPPNNMDATPDIPGLEPEFSL